MERGKPVYYCHGYLVRKIDGRIYINFCNRERMEFEEWVLQAMLGIEEAAKRRNGINAITTGICWN